MKENIKCGKETSKCAFCRQPYTKTNEQAIARMRKLAEKGDPNAMKNLGMFLMLGNQGLPQDVTEAKELFLRAGQLGNACAYFLLGDVYLQEGDQKRGKRFTELAAMTGDANARFKLVSIELTSGNHQRASKHILIAARSGVDEALDAVREGYLKEGKYTKDEYERALKAYQRIHEDRKSEMRLEADMYSSNPSLYRTIR